MIIIGLGANLPSDAGPPERTLETALAELARAGVRIVRRSRWYTSPPDPPSDQPWYVNGVAAVETDLAPERLLEVLHSIEARHGRRREAPNAPRPIDLDLIDYHGLVRADGGGLVLPHPRTCQRAFVLLPLTEVAPDWRHPVSGKTLAALVAELPSGAVARPLQLFDEKE